MMNFALVEPLMGEHDDAGRGVSWLLCVPAEPTAARTIVAVTAARIAARRRFVKPTSSSDESLRVLPERGVSAFPTPLFKWETKKLLHFRTRRALRGSRGRSRRPPRRRARGRRRRAS